MDNYTAASNDAIVDLFQRTIERRNRAIGKQRIGDLNKLFAHRYRARREDYIFPDDDAGQEDLKILLHHYALNNPLAMPRIIKMRAPWVQDASGLLAQIDTYPRKWRSETLGKLLRVTAAEWRALRLRTISPIDMTTEERRQELTATPPRANADQTPQGRENAASITQAVAAEPGRAARTHVEHSIVVVIPLCDGATYIKRAIESVFAQTIQPAEIVVVDDGSGDDGPEIVMALPQAEKITLLRKSNGGQSSARNFGVKSSKSSLIAFLDQDDLWYPRHLEVLSRLIGRLTSSRWDGCIPIWTRSMGMGI